MYASVPLQAERSSLFEPMAYRLQQRKLAVTRRPTPQVQTIKNFPKFRSRETTLSSLKSVPCQPIRTNQPALAEFYIRKHILKGFQ